MKLALWLGCALLALLWTGGAALTAALTQWAAQVLASGGAVDLAQAAARWPVPDWIALWVDPQAVRWAQQMVLWALGLLGSLSAGLPVAGQVVGWLVPLVWVFWGLGMLVLLALALGVHVWLWRSAARGRA
ncbi:MAG: hypothetical protein ACR2IY_11490 [Rubrivivax sp.]